MRERPYDPPDWRITGAPPPRTGKTTRAVLHGALQRVLRRGRRRRGGIPRAKGVRLDRVRANGRIAVTQVGNRLNHVRLWQIGVCLDSHIPCAVDNLHGFAPELSTERPRADEDGNLVDVVRCRTVDSYLRLRIVPGVVVGDAAWNLLRCAVFGVMRWAELAHDGDDSGDKGRTKRADHGQPGDGHRIAPTGLHIQSL